jgi:8-oxo-dGTP diphosphatase
MTIESLERTIASIEPYDAIERAHQDATRRWIASGAPLYRIRKPADPDPHLVAYFAVVDVDANSILLVDHRLAGRWLPTGGHVEPDEDPRDTVTRELSEELGITADLVAGLSSNPLFITQTTTVDADAGHVDVSLWYVVAATVATAVEPDASEFNATRWWSFDELRTADPNHFDPHLPRFMSKLERDLAAPR